MIEQRDQPVLEQRQPMLHARQPPPVADRLIQRIGSGIGAELLTVTGAEALDAVLVEQGFAGGQQQMLGHHPGRALGVGIEQPQRFQLVAEEIEPQPGIESRGINVED